jgi:hypothetical protein
MEKSWDVLNIHYQRISKIRFWWQRLSECAWNYQAQRHNSIARHKTLSEGKKAKFLVVSPQQSYTWCFEPNWELEYKLITHVNLLSSDPSACLIQLLGFANICSSPMTHPRNMNHVWHEPSKDGLVCELIITQTVYATRGTFPIFAQNIKHRKSAKKRSTLYTDTVCIVSSYSWHIRRIPKQKQHVTTQHSAAHTNRGAQASTLSDGVWTNSNGKSSAFP